MDRLDDMEGVNKTPAVTNKSSLVIMVIMGIIPAGTRPGEGC